MTIVRGGNGWPIAVSYDLNAPSVHSVFVAVNNLKILPDGWLECY